MEQYIQQRGAILTSPPQKVGVENIVGDKLGGLDMNSGTNDELRLPSIVPNEADLDEPHGEGLKSVMFLFVFSLYAPSCVNFQIFGYEKGSEKNL